MKKLLTIRKSLSYFLILSFSTCLYSCGNPKRPVQTIPVDTNKVYIAPDYYIYVENSASMDGYVKGVTEFKTAVYNYLSDIKIADIAGTLNLFYINSKEIPYGSDLPDFIEKLDPTTFRMRGGDRGTTDISELLKMVLRNTTDNNVSILISDFIFSPGKGKDAGQYLINQQIGIKNSMADHLKRFPDHAVLIYQLESKFDGTFFNKDDKPITFNGQRPYYIWIIGNKNYLSYLRLKCPENKFKGGGVKNTFSIINGGTPVKYAIQYGSGNFKPDKKDPSKSIVDAQKDTKGVGEKLMRFSVNANFSTLLLDDNYLLDKQNYDMNDKDYHIEIQKNNTPTEYTHTLKLSTSIVKPSTLTIRLKRQIPQWVEQINDDSGLNISEAKDKTYGFKYLIYGVYEAFTKDVEYATEIKLNINQKSK